MCDDFGCSRNVVRCPPFNFSFEKCEKSDFQLHHLWVAMDSMLVAIVESVISTMFEDRMTWICVEFPETGDLAIHMSKGFFLLFHVICFFSKNYFFFDYINQLCKIMIRQHLVNKWKKDQIWEFYVYDNFLIKGYRDKFWCWISDVFPPRHEDAPSFEVFQDFQLFCKITTCWSRRVDFYIDINGPSDKDFIGL